MAFAAQALGAQKADKPLEQGGALEQVGARMKRVMGLTSKLSRRWKRAKPAVAGRLERSVRQLDHADLISEAYKAHKVWRELGRIRSQTARKATELQREFLGRVRLCSCVDFVGTYP